MEIICWLKSTHPQSNCPCKNSWQVKIEDLHKQYIRDKNLKENFLMALNLPEVQTKNHKFEEKDFEHNS